MKRPGGKGTRDVGTWLAALALLAACGDGTTAPPATGGAEAPDPDSVLAFPGAEGFGAYAKGGRGGPVFFVTSLADDGSAGTLRAAAEASGPRTIVFRVGGTVVLRDQLLIENPFITIAGQTAPGGGIQITGDGRIGRPLVKIVTNDVVLRHLRIRPGPSSISGGAPGRAALVVESPAAQDVMLDHISVSWAEDKAFIVFGGARRVTLQWSILAETLYCANHLKTVSPGVFDTPGECSTGGVPHSRAVTISATPEDRGTPTSGTPPDQITLHHNLFAHNNKRHPNVTSHTVVDFVNNVVYNPGDLGANLGIKDRGQGLRVTLNYVKNYVRAGPGTEPGLPMVSAPSTTESDAISLYFSENVLEGPLTEYSSFFAERGYLSEARAPAAPVSETSAADALAAVLARSGATLPTRDAVDRRLAEEAVNGSGRFVDDPSEVGGWPELATGIPPTDSDLDGMPDAWEASLGLDPSDPSDATEDRDLDGWTNLEEWLNSIGS